MVREQALILLLAVVCPMSAGAAEIGNTEIQKWPDGKKGAISLTYDDGSVNQFKVAMPLMDKYHLPGTFFVITGEVKGSKYKPKYIGRPFAVVAQEAAKKPTNRANFLERAGALRASGYEGMGDIHAKIGGTYEAGKPLEAYHLVDEAYAKIRRGEIKPASDPEFGVPGPMSWGDFKKMAARGHEFASHTVSHPYLSTFDDKNLLYELEKSKAEIKEQLGPRYTFSVEYPYGTEDKRVLERAFHIYPLVRNWMADKEVEDIIRGDDKDPVSSKKDYVLWQRGALTKTPLFLMKKWVDLTARQGNVWLVLVFHGVDGIGWEPEPHQKFEEYFKYIHSKLNDVWVGTFQDVGKYLRERVSTQVSTRVTPQSIRVMPVSKLSHKLYSVPLSLKTYVPSGWENVRIERKDGKEEVESASDANGTYVTYKAVPNAGPVTLIKGEAD